MIAVEDFIINKVSESRLKDINLENIPFGKNFTDHMLEADYINGEWQTPEIKPYQALKVDPSLAVFHYGQAIFEGIKAYKTDDGKAHIFRPEDNFHRFNISAKRMQMPEVPEHIFMDGMKLLVNMDKDWIPAKIDHALYIRPFMISTDYAVGVKPSESYKFMIILSPSGPYYSAPMRIHVEEYYVRAVEGGVGYAKAAGNYGAAMFATAEAKKNGYDQVLWTDPIQHRYVQECGTMNVFFIIGNKAITPSLNHGTILAGVTRLSAMTLLQEIGFIVEERDISIEELIDAYKAGVFYEAFGTGTAATISYIKELRYKDFEMKFNVDMWRTAPELKRRLDDIRYGKVEDTHGWLMEV